MWDKIINNFVDKYSREARLYPTMIALLPVYLIMLTIFTSYDQAVAFIRVTFGISLSLILIYMGTDIIRNIGKILETKIFGNELFFPTTSRLLHSDDKFSKEKKLQLCEKIHSEFGINFLTQKDEGADGHEARKIIKEAIGLIRQKLGNGRLLLQYNIRYGFWRNLIAASPFSFSLSFVSVIVSTIVPSTMIFAISLCLTPLYLLLWVYRRVILTYFADQYAEQFYLEYKIS